MHNENAIGQEHAGWKPDLDSVWNGEQSERMEIGHENIRKSAMADFLREIETYGGVIVPMPKLKLEVQKVVDDFKSAVAAEDARIDPTLPAKASLDGYKAALTRAKERAMVRMGEIVARSGELFED